VSFEVLNFSFVFFRRITRCEGTKIPPLSGFGVLLSRVQAVLTRFKFPDHLSASSGLSSVIMPAARHSTTVTVTIDSSLLFAGNGKLKMELFHGLTHERGEIGRLPGRDQIGVNNHLPVLIESAGLF
jgi:hypothetical protein